MDRNGRLPLLLSLGWVASLVIGCVSPGLRHEPPEPVTAAPPPGASDAPDLSIGRFVRPIEEIRVPSMALPELYIDDSMARMVAPYDEDPAPTGELHRPSIAESPAPLPGAPVPSDSAITGGQDPPTDLVTVSPLPAARSATVDRPAATARAAPAVEPPIADAGEARGTAVAEPPPVSQRPPPPARAAAATPATPTGGIEREADAAAVRAAGTERLVLDGGVVSADDELSIVLPGTGWLYVGNDSAGGRVTLLGKSRSGGNEQFRFRIAAPGDYRLWFQRQDTATGLLRDERVALQAQPDAPSREISVADLIVLTQPVSAAPEVAAIAPSVTAAAPVRVSEPADDRSDEPQRPPITGLAELAEALRSGAVTISELPDADLHRFASLANDTYPVPVLRLFWRAIAGSGGGLEARARQALLEIAVREQDEVALVEAVRLIDPVREAAAGTAAGTALRELGDESIYRLARRLEHPGPERDLARALSLYRLIVDERPLSAHWDASRTRIEYLRRHYIDVR